MHDIIAAYSFTDHPARARLTRPACGALQVVRFSCHIISTMELSRSDEASRVARETARIPATSPGTHNISAASGDGGNDTHFSWTDVVNLGNFPGISDNVVRSRAGSEIYRDLRDRK